MAQNDPQDRIELEDLDDIWDLDLINDNLDSKILSLPFLDNYSKDKQRWPELYIKRP